MKKILAIALVAMLGFSTQSFAQNKVLNRTITAENGKKMLTGEFTRKALEEDDFKEWYHHEYDTYEVEKSKLKGLIKKLSDDVNKKSKNHNLILELDEKINFVKHNFFVK